MLSMFYRKISVWAGVLECKVSRVRVIDSKANCSYSAGYISVCVWIFLDFDLNDVTL